jgi:hypothetical protein
MKTRKPRFATQSPSRQVANDSVQVRAELRGAASVLAGAAGDGKKRILHDIFGSRFTPDHLHGEPKDHVLVTPIQYRECPHAISSIPVSDRESALG